MNKESERLQQENWKKWGPYLSERQWRSCLGNLAGV